MKVLVIGAGGHGQVVADILRAGARAGDADEFIGYLDDRPEHVDAAILGPVTAWRSIVHDAVIVAIGDNFTRARLTEQFRAAGERIATVRHPSAIVAGGIDAGDGAMFCAGSVVSVGVSMGRGVILNTASTIDHHSRI